MGPGNPLECSLYLGTNNSFTCQSHQSKFPLKFVVKSSTNTFYCHINRRKVHVTKMLLGCRRRVTCYCPLFLSVIFYCVVFLLQCPQSRESPLCQLNGFHFTACLVTGLVTYQKIGFFFNMYNCFELSYH